MDPRVGEGGSLLDKRRQRRLKHDRALGMGIQGRGMGFDSICIEGRRFGRVASWFTPSIKVHQVYEVCLGYGIYWED
jgi:hypothetical protein